MENFRATALLILASLLAGCGGSGGSEASVAVPDALAPATVSVVLTDAETQDYDEALATVTRVELLGEGSPQVIFSGEATVDLLRLRDAYEFFAVADDVRPGTYNKIRLILSRLLLIRRDGNGNVIDEIDADLPPKLDLNPQGPFQLDAGDVVVVTIDLDMKKSLMFVTTGNGRVKVRPVAFVDIDTRPPVAKFTRISGEIVELFPDVAGLRICRAGLTADPAGPFAGQLPDRLLCLDVLTNERTGIFGPDGLPTDFSALMVGDAVTIAGRLGIRPRPTDDCGAGNDPEACPLGDAEPAEIVACPLTDNDCADNEYLPRFLLRAFVIEQGGAGSFKRYAGTAIAAVDGEDRFDFELAPGQGLVGTPVLATQLYPQTRIFTRNGLEVGTDAITAGKRAIVDAVLSLSNTDPDELRAALVILEPFVAPEDVLAGSILTIEPFLVSTPDGDRCVNLAPDSELFLVESAEDGGLDSQRVTLDQLASGQPVSLFGQEDGGGCFNADTVIAGTEPGDAG